MNLASVGRPKMPLLGSSKSATSMTTLSVRKLSFVLKVTTEATRSIGMVTPRVALEKGRVGHRLPGGTYIFSNTAEDKRFSPAPPSTSMFVALMLQIMGEITRGSYPTPAVLLGWCSLPKTIKVSDHLSGHDASSLGSSTFTSSTGTLT